MTENTSTSEFAGCTTSRRGGPVLFTLAFTALLSACAGAPPEEPVVEKPIVKPEDVELTLNLPDDRSGCVCEVEEVQDRTFLERGMQTLAEGDYVEAVQYFQRYRRLETEALAQWEADIAIAYASMLPSSPFYDVEAASGAYIELQSQEPVGEKHHSIVLMQQALESFVLMDRHIADLENRTSMLEDDLDKREQALRRLRELTLGQPEGEL
ncbi:MAG: hypothetical protein AAFY29_18405 [Pseudomonadota bacterium]